MSSSFMLPLDPNNVNHLEAFLAVLNDGKVRAGLKRQTNLPTGLAQLVGLVDDPKFLTMSRSVAKKYAALNQGTATFQEVKTEGKALYEFLQANYPEALTLLRKYGEGVTPQGPRLQGWTAANTNVAANAQAAANAVVYVNVAAATNVAVALEAVAVVGVVVS